MNTLKKAPLSVAIITLNEEARLPDCLKSVSFADDVVVVDSGSTDQTVAIAEDSRARVFIENWRGFGPQKQFAIDQCKHNWVLILDADERVPQETSEAITEMLAQDHDHVAFSFPRKNYFSGRWIRYGGWWPDRITRLINKKSCSYEPQIVHEMMQVNGTTGSINSPLIHYTNRDLHQTMAKMNSYSSAGAEQILRKGGSATPFTAISRALWSFFRTYILRLGVFDGFQGMVIAVSDSVNVFFKYAKLIEMKKTDKK